MSSFNEFDQSGTVPQRNFSDIISHSFNNYMKVIGWGILMLVLTYLLSTLFSFLISAVSGYDQEAAAEVVRDMIQNKDFSLEKMQEISTTEGYGLNSILSGIVGILLFPMYVGFVYILNKANVGTFVQFSDLFIGYRQNTVQILIYGLINTIVIGISMAMCFFPLFLVAPLFILGVPILLFENATAIEAIKKSFNIASKDYGTFFGVNAIALIIAFAGIALCFIGVVASAPFYFAAMYSIYSGYCGLPRQINYNN